MALGDSSRRCPSRRTLRRDVLPPNGDDEAMKRRRRHRSATDEGKRLAVSDDDDDEDLDGGALLTPAAARGAAFTASSCKKKQPRRRRRLGDMLFVALMLLFLSVGETTSEFASTQRSSSARYAFAFSGGALRHRSVRPGGQLYPGCSGGGTAAVYLAASTLLGDEVETPFSPGTTPLSDYASTTTRKDTKDPDKRPHEQRVSGPRKARRLNHGFQHLYRHEDPSHYASFENLTLPINITATEYLVRYGGYEAEDLVQMNRTFPPLLDLDVRRHLRPKMRFLKHTLGGAVASVDVDKGKDPSSSGDDAPNAPSIRTLSSPARLGVPPQYYGARLERTVAPRHAFFEHARLPHGPALLEDDGKLLREFLVSSRRTKQFCALCNTWRRKYGVYDPDGVVGEEERERLTKWDVTPRQVERFDALFQRGLMAATRDDMLQDKQRDDDSNSEDGPLGRNAPTSAEMIRLLVRHGANPLERDVRGVSLIHWAAGCGNIDALKELAASLPGGMHEALRIKADRDGATPLHWAAAGAGSKEFGTGGHMHVCRYVLDRCDDAGDERQVVNTLTKDGNSVLMWAAWSSALDVVKLLVRSRADPAVANRNGCTVAHWAASGGDVDVCRYLFESAGVDFAVPNYAGNTPLSHAVAYGRADVVRWLREEVGAEDEDGRATELARDFVGWTGGRDRTRGAVFDLFRDDDWYGSQNDRAETELVEGDGETSELDDLL